LVAAADLQFFRSFQIGSEALLVKRGLSSQLHQKRLTHHQ
jgi:hypothetical protein